jgi:hypothetical protein
MSPEMIVDDVESFLIRDGFDHRGMNDLVSVVCGDPGRVGGDTGEETVVSSRIFDELHGGAPSVWDDFI